MTASLPLHEKIQWELENEILSGRLQPEQRIPSVRELAIRFGVNPNTVQQAIREMQRSGLLISRRGRGVLVTDEMDRICDLRQERGRELARTFIGQMEALGYSPKFIMEEMDIYGQDKQIQDTSE